ncbi:hypothetical protein NBRC3280_2627 [Acetobacter pasteurianus NBRC 3280]|uniref:Uncharacterized protein n=1 Tax=Acetobacter pasteurianus NBRC 3278 TaxID=1226660 RepID=A0A401X8S4_ACEPA|nr:hypothetical protein NBRC3277_3282 [Acetobacter pasteurianus NBRC 3277]GCD64301.1 hypothetical protein NBRC3278_3394 [Acetobacter pasteurianus NBRC 3278]GCD69992.1 hypothetical protein NBRC3280_2627 [Acetobacter pasteurianus NBRC 3280]
MTHGVISGRTYIARSPLFWSEYALPRLCDIGFQQHPDIACVRDALCLRPGFHGVQQGCWQAHVGVGT